MIVVRPDMLLDAVHSMSTAYKILIMGASYGSLLGAKLLAAGHTVKLICLPALIVALWISKNALNF